MKKIWMSSLSLLIVIFFCSCSLLMKPQAHKNRFIYLWTKPVTVDTAKISKDSKKTFLLEAYLSNGTPVLVFVKAPILREVMRIKWPENGISMDRTFEGYAFTADGLGSKSILTEKEAENMDVYDESQKELLLRYRKREKFELLSALPISARGKIENEKIVLVTDQSETQLSSPGRTWGRQN